MHRALTIGLVVGSVIGSVSCSSLPGSKEEEPSIEFYGKRVKFHGPQTCSRREHRSGTWKSWLPDTRACKREGPYASPAYEECIRQRGWSEDREVPCAVIEQQYAECADSGEQLLVCVGEIGIEGISDLHFEPR